LLINKRRRGKNRLSRINKIIDSQSMRRYYSAYRNSMISLQLQEVSHMTREAWILETVVLNLQVHSVDIVTAISCFSRITWGLTLRHEKVSREGETWIYVIESHEGLQQSCVFPEETEFQKFCSLKPLFSSKSSHKILESIEVSKATGKENRIYYWLDSFYSCITRFCKTGVWFRQLFCGENFYKTERCTSIWVLRSTWIAQW
jgi:hypothetical protein